MKYLITGVFTLFFTISAFAQSPRIENFADFRTETYPFKKGKGDSVQYKIKGKADTLLTTIFRHNNTKQRSYSKDSSLFFDVKGRIRFKYFGFDSIHYQYDSTVSFSEKGHFIEIKSNVERRRMLKRYDENGRLLMNQYEMSDPSVPDRKWEFLKDADGNFVNIKRLDSIIVNNKKRARMYDTLFYNNHQIYSVKAYQENEDNRLISLGAQIYNLDGSLRESEMSDSLRLVPFKDNVDCYYGLKNLKNDTIFRPQFDRVQYRATLNAILAYTGDLCKLYTMDGKPMPQPSNLLSGIFPLSSYSSIYYDDVMGNQADIRGVVNKLGSKNKVQYIGFVEESHRYGVMTKDGQIVIPLQLLQLEGSEIDGRFFSFSERLGDSVLSIGYLDKRGKRIFPNYKHVQYAGIEDYFIVSLTHNGDRFGRTFVLLQPQTFGLGRGGVETMVFEPKFDRIIYMPKLNLFLTALSNIPNKIDSEERFTQSIHGLFNPRINKWVLEAKDYAIINTETVKNHSFFVLKNVKTKKYCLIDTIGKFIVTPAMSVDSIGIIDDIKGLFWMRKKDKYQFFDIKNGQIVIRPTVYEYLEKIEFRDIVVSIQDEYIYFLAKRKGKWGFMKTDESIALPFDFDYASEVMNYRESEAGIVLVKNDKASYFNLASLPNEDPELPNGGNSEEKSLINFGLVENRSRVYFVNDTGRVVIPPQYKMLSADESWGFVLVEDAKQSRKLIFTSANKTIDVPFKHDIRIASPKSTVMIVSDSLDNTFGVASAMGKELVPCFNYGVAIGSLDSSIFFVKRDTPKIQRYVEDGIEPLHVNPDSLNIEDANWMMFDSTGKQIDAQSFRFPIDFNDGIGIGMQGDDFNVYQTDGTILTPFRKDKTVGIPRNFNNIRRMESNGYFVFYRNQGLTPTMILTDKTGKILVESGRYDGISDYFDKYALVSSGKKIGMIDTLGNEIIALQDLLSSSYPFVDSINHDKMVLHGIADKKEDYALEANFTLNTGKYHFNKDSLKTTEANRASLLNLILQKNIKRIVNTANNFKISRTYSSLDGGFVQYDRGDYRRAYILLSRLAITDKSMAFTWADNDGSDAKFYNFKKENDRWIEKSLYDVLDLQGDKRWALNDLLTRKIKALKDVSIDCSNSGAFIKQVENAFMLTEKGIDFCFTADDYSGEFVVIDFSWAELKPFIK